MSAATSTALRPERCKHIDVDLCAGCEKLWADSLNSISVARCADCARNACTCLLEHGQYEGETVRRYFCMPGAKGGCTPAEADEEG